MTEYRRTRQITDIDWNKVFSIYETIYNCSIDGAVDERGKFWQENRTTMGRRLGACTVYFYDHPIIGKEMYRDEILSQLGIELGYEEVTG